MVKLDPDLPVILGFGTIRFNKISLKVLNEAPEKHQSTIYFENLL